MCMSMAHLSQAMATMPTATVCLAVHTFRGVVVSSRHQYLTRHHACSLLCGAAHSILTYTRQSPSSATGCATGAPAAAPAAPAPAAAAPPSAAVLGCLGAQHALWSLPVLPLLAWGASVSMLSVSACRGSSLGSRARLMRSAAPASTRRKPQCHQSQTHNVISRKRTMSSVANTQRRQSPAVCVNAVQPNRCSTTFHGRFTASERIGLWHVLSHWLLPCICTSCCQHLHV